LIQVSQVATEPWDFTLYKSRDGCWVLKVVFSEGIYKIDVGRYFLLDRPQIESANTDELKRLSAQIRANYPDVSPPEIAKSDLTFIK
jgi:hypothetical protein